MRPESFAVVARAAPAAAAARNAASPVRTARTTRYVAATASRLTSAALLNIAEMATWLGSSAAITPPTAAVVGEPGAARRSVATTSRISGTVSAVDSRRKRWDDHSGQPQAPRRSEGPWISALKSDEVEKLGLARFGSRAGSSRHPDSARIAPPQRAPRA